MRGRLVKEKLFKLKGLTGLGVGSIKGIRGVSMLTGTLLKEVAMKKIIMTLLFLIIFQTVVVAETLKGGYPACVSEELWVELVRASTTKDKHAQDYLFQNGCITTKGGFPITILERGYKKSIKVRVYLDDGDAIILWTHMNNVK
jgi:hypothetical protein